MVRPVGANTMISKVSEVIHFTKLKFRRASLYQFVIRWVFFFRYSSSSSSDITKNCLTSNLSDPVTLLSKSKFNTSQVSCRYISISTFNFFYLGLRIPTGKENRPNSQTLAGNNKIPIRLLDSTYSVLPFTSPARSMLCSILLAIKSKSGH